MTAADWQGVRDSNPRMPESKSGALPTWRTPCWEWTYGTDSNPRGVAAPLLSRQCRLASRASLQTGGERRVSICNKFPCPSAFKAAPGAGRDRSPCMCWSGWSGSNRRPRAPKARALPGCATPRKGLVARAGVEPASQGYGPCTEPFYYLATTGGTSRIRTDDILLAKQALSQLSYGPDVLGSGGRTRTCDTLVNSQAFYR
jgi:hypothetical protein